MAGLSQSRHSTKVGVAIVIATEYIEANKQSPGTYTRFHTYTFFFLLFVFAIRRLQTLVTSDGSRGVARQSTFLHNKGMQLMAMLTKLVISNVQKLTLTVGRGNSSIHLFVGASVRVEGKSPCQLRHSFSPKLPRIRTCKGGFQ